MAARVDVPTSNKKRKVGTKKRLSLRPPYDWVITGRYNMLPTNLFNPLQLMHSRNASMTPSEQCLIDFIYNQVDNHN